MPELLAGNLPRSMARRKTVAKQWHAALAEGSARADARRAPATRRAADACRARRGDRVWAKIHGFRGGPRRCAMTTTTTPPPEARVRFFHAGHVQAVGTVCGRRCPAGGGGCRS